jgi:cell division protein FtsI (penicillin-binding protein 3)
MLICIALAFITLIGRALWLQVLNNDFLQRKGESRYMRDLKISASRGMIVDRNNEPLAISTPVESVKAGQAAAKAEQEAKEQAEADAKAEADRLETEAKAEAQAQAERAAAAAAAQNGSVTA